MSNLGQILGDQLLRIDTLETMLASAGNVKVNLAAYADLQDAGAEIERQRQVIAGLNERASRAEQQLALAQSELTAAQAESSAATQRAAAAEKRADGLQVALDALNQRLTEINAATFIDDRGRRVRWNAINRVRNVIEAYGSWVFIGDIRQGLTDIPAAQVSTALLLLLKRGIIERQGEPRRYQYRAVRVPA